MAESPLASLHKEVLDYLRASEHLVTAVLMSNYGSLSKDELDLIEYYVTEVAKILPVLKK